MVESACKGGFYQNTTERRRPTTGTTTPSCTATLPIPLTLARRRSRNHGSAHAVELLLGQYLVHSVLGTGKSGCNVCGSITDPKLRRFLYRITIIILIKHRDNSSYYRFQIKIINMDTSSSSSIQYLRARSDSGGNPCSRKGSRGSLHTSIQFHMPETGDADPLRTHNCSVRQRITPLQRIPTTTRSGTDRELHVSRCATDVGCDDSLAHFVDRAAANGCSHRHSGTRGGEICHSCGSAGLVLHCVHDSGDCQSPEETTRVYHASP